MQQRYITHTPAKVYSISGLAVGALIVFIALQGLRSDGWISSAWFMGGICLTGLAAYRWGTMRQAPARTRTPNGPQDIEEKQGQEKLSMAGMLAAGIAHEIRNPLTSLRGFIQLSPELKPEYAELMLSEVDRINEIVTELLQLAVPKSDAGYEPRMLQTVIEQTVMLLEAQANLLNVRLIIEAGQQEMPIMVSCDENKLKQVFINLIKNAVEASTEGGAVVIRLNRDCGEAIVEVMDAGDGMSEEQLKQLGNPFYTTKEHGSGLGLMICRQIVQDHGGAIAFRSEIGQGTIVRVNLPIDG